MKGLTDIESLRRIDIHLGRPLGAWWDHYYAGITSRPPDRLLVAEVRHFVETLRVHAGTLLGPGLRSDHVAYLLSAGGMLATSIADLEFVVRDLAEWYDELSPRPRRDMLAIRIRAAAAAPKRIRPRFDETPRAAMRPDPGRIAVPTALPPGSRAMPIGGVHLIAGVGHKGEMTMGVPIDGFIWIISAIDDRRGRDGSRTPTPVPELTA